MVDRGRYITIGASDDEAAKLHALAEAEGVSASDFLRLYIRRAYADRFGERRHESPIKTSKRGGPESVRRWVAEAKAKKR